MSGSAIFDPTEAYRYLLTRRWLSVAPPVVFVMLNPGTATAETGDPTVRRAISDAYAWGYGGLNVLNIFAYRSTDPRALETVADPVGPENDRYNAPLTDAAAVNSIRWTLLQALQRTGLFIETGSGGRTKRNRTRRGIPKTHALDAACVGDVADVRRSAHPALHITYSGRGSRSRTRLHRFGFPRGYLLREKSVNGFRTGDPVKASGPRGKKAGVSTVRVAIRASGSFTIPPATGVVQAIGYRACTMLARGDGYAYSHTPQAGHPKERMREAGHAAA